MIKDLTIFDWLRTLIALVLFLGPGFAVLSIFSKRALFSIKGISIFAPAFSASVCFWAVLFVWLKLANITVNWLFVGLLCVIGWGFTVFRFWPLKKPFFRFSWHENKYDLYGGILLALMLIIFRANIAEQVAGLGSDSYHHTLISALILDHGQLPSNYFPLAPIVTFTYHFGFHLVTTIFAWLTGLPVRLLVLIMGPVLMIFAALSTGLLTQVVTKNRTAEVFAIGTVALLGIFPAAMLNWGRYPQLTGLIIIASVLTLIYLITVENRTERFSYVLIALMVAGLVLTHYRIAAFYVIGQIALLIVHFAFTRTFLKDLKQLFGLYGSSAALTAVLLLPWLLIVFFSRGEGVAIVHQLTVDSSFYSIQRLGQGILNYPTNIPLILLSATAILLGVFQKKFFVYWMVAWWGALYILTSPLLFGSLVDRITLYVSLFIPAAVLSAYFLAWLLEKIKSYTAGRDFTVVVVTLILLIGLWLSPPQFGVRDGYITAEDLPAMDWIRENVADDALFMVNTFNFPFSDDFIIGSDAGYWLPLLTGKHSVVPPMSYQNERFEDREMIDALISLHQLGGKLTGAEAINMLQEKKVTHIYIGSRGGDIDPQSLLSSPDFELEYQHQSNYVFSVK
jgi:hypothetical protein